MADYYKNLLAEKEAPRPSLTTVEMAEARRRLARTPEDSGASSTPLPSSAAITAEMIGALGIDSTPLLASVRGATDGILWVSI